MFAMRKSVSYPTLQNVGQDLTKVLAMKTLKTKVLEPHTAIAFSESQ
jgi:hypothetical protein